jgi:hypothetical protein
MSHPFNPRVVRETHASRASESLVCLTAALCVVVDGLVRGIVTAETFKQACGTWRDAATKSDPSGSRALTVTTSEALPTPVPPPVHSTSRSFHMADGTPRKRFAHILCMHDRSLEEACAACMRCEHGHSSAYGGGPCSRCHPRVVDIIDEAAFDALDWIPLAESEEPTQSQIAEYVDALVAGHFDQSIAAERDWE